jgi:hypothetical protein
MLLCLSSPLDKQLCFNFSAAWNSAWKCLLGCGQDRVGATKAGSYEVTPSGLWEKGPGAADGSLEGQHLGCGSRIEGQAAPGVWG